MKYKIKIKIGIDFLMTVLLLCLMAYQITGQELHEWIGTGMLVLFIVHNILNIKWYGSIAKGKYTLLRLVQTILNLSVFISMICLGFSGIVMSQHVFAALSIRGPTATARSMHMAASYWGFVLMSMHMGMHWSQVLGALRRVYKDKKTSGIFTWGLRLAAILIAGYGLLCFIQKDIVSYMFLKNQFVFFDFEQNALSVFKEYIAMMGFWMFLSYYISRGIKKNYMLQVIRKETINMKAEEFQQIFPLGDKNDAYAQFFVGQSYLKMLSTERLSIANVTFEPSCRNNWHIHHKGGQVLLCTAGRGYYQEWGKAAQELKPGDVVNIPPEVKHWHGAAPNSWFSHLAVEVPAVGASNEWLEEVDEQEYKKLTEKEKSNE